MANNSAQPSSTASPTKDSGNKEFVFQTEDKVQVKAKENVAKISETLKSIIENRAKDDKSVIPITCLSSAIFKKVLTWAEYHSNDPPILDDNDFNDDYISEWDKQFLNVDNSTLFELIVAANYLDIRRLLDISCRIVADMIRGKSAEDVRKMFDIKNDFTREEEEKMKKENEWAERKN